MICICGESGSGKTTSIRNLNPEETFIITTTGKRPGIPGAKKKYRNLNTAGKNPEELGNFYTTTSVDNVATMLYIVVSTHSENIGDRVNQYLKIKTLGKMLDSVITLEGLFTYVLFTTIEKDEENKPRYMFKTNSDGTCTAKSPMGLFDELLIDNDLNMVISRIKEYNGED